MKNVQSKEFELSAKVVLTREELRKVKGGVLFLCKLYNTDGTSAVIYVPANNGNAAQCAVDQICWNLNTCKTASCGPNSGGC